MHKKLILLAFEKAKKRKENNGEKKPSLTTLAEDISDYIYKETRFRLGERSFRDYLNEAKKLYKTEEDISIKQSKVLDGLYKYLGYEDYGSFVAANEIPLSINNKKWEIIALKIKFTLTKHKRLFFIFLMTTLLIVFIIYKNQPNWMVWQNDHYVKVSFNLDKYDLDDLKIYKKDRILNFRQINLPDCNTQFFKVNGEPNVWYGKNTKGELEYFTDNGLHPETGDTLKKITKYMIKTHICYEWK